MKVVFEKGLKKISKYIELIYCVIFFFVFVFYAVNNNNFIKFMINLKMDKEANAVFIGVFLLFSSVHFMINFLTKMFERKEV